jgi:sucrose-6F-phosphate phosphohydrolase
VGARRLLVTDLDGTLLGDDLALERFRAWLGPRRDGHRLVYASGRRFASVDELVAGGVLPRPDAVISGVGTEIDDPAGRPWPGWSARFDGWDADRVRETLRSFSRLVLQADVFQSPLKASYDVPGLTVAESVAIRRALIGADLDATLVYSSELHLDILPSRAGKGQATRFLADGWAIETGDILAFGDSGNDAELLGSGFRGTIVANALPELVAAIDREVYRSPEPYADGVLDGIRFWSER